MLVEMFNYRFIEQMRIIFEHSVFYIIQTMKLFHGKVAVQRKRSRAFFNFLVFNHLSYYVHLIGLCTNGTNVALIMVKISFRLTLRLG